MLESPSSGHLLAQGGKRVLAESLTALAVEILTGLLLHSVPNGSIRLAVQMKTRGKSVLLHCPSMLRPRATL